MPAGSTREEAERPVVRLEYHLLAFARKHLDQIHPAVAQPHLRCLDRARRARQDRLFVAPVELVDLARIEAQRHMGLRGRQRSAPAAPGRL